MVKIFLIRHGESIQNTNENLKNLPGHLVYLTEKGREQSNECGKFLKSYCDENGINLKKSILYVSTFERARETARIINKHLNIECVKEDFCLTEQQYGIFENVHYDEWAKYGKQYEHYAKYYNNKGKFYAKLPQGESPFDVALRVKQFINATFNDFDDEVENIFIVSHGITIRAFLVAYFNYSPEWFENESNMKNCSVRLIERQSQHYSIDKDYIYGGRKHSNKDDLNG